MARSEYQDRRWAVTPSHCHNEAPYQGPGGLLGPGIGDIGESHTVVVDAQFASDGQAHDLLESCVPLVGGQRVVRVAEELQRAAAQRHNVEYGRRCCRAAQIDEASERLESANSRRGRNTEQGVDHEVRAAVGGLDETFGES